MDSGIPSCEDFFSAHKKIEELERLLIIAGKCSLRQENYPRELISWWECKRKLDACKGNFWIEEDKRQ